MKINKIIYSEKGYIFAKYHHPKSDDALDYMYTIQIKESVMQPVIIKLKFNGIPPYIAPMPPKEHIIKAENMIVLLVKLNRWFKKYGYIIK